MLLCVPTFGLGHIGRVQSSNAVLSHFSQPKVENLCRSTRGHKDVCWLDVPVHDALGVCGIKCLSNINRDREQSFDFHCPIANEMF